MLSASAALSLMLLYGAAMLALVSGYALLAGMSLAPLGRALWRPAPVIALIALILGSWAYTLTMTLIA